MLLRRNDIKKAVSIRFLKWTAVGASAYQTGQIAGFPGKVAKRLVDGGHAEFMRKGMDYDPATAMWGSGPAPQQPPPKPSQED